MKCVVCGEKIPKYMPYGTGGTDDYFRERWPITFRKATFNSYCYALACEEAIYTAAPTSQYINRYDEYLTKFR